MACSIAEINTQHSEHGLQALHDLATHYLLSPSLLTHQGLSMSGSLCLKDFSLDPPRNRSLMSKALKMAFPDYSIWRDKRAHHIHQLSF